MMNMIKLGLYGMMAGTLSLGVAVAAPGDEDAPKRGDRGGERAPRQDPAERFASLDTDSSGDLSLEEFKVAHAKRMAAMKERMGDREPPAGRTPPTAEEVFKRLDKNGDEVLTPDEMRRVRRGGQRGPGGPGGGERGPGPGGPGPGE